MADIRISSLPSEPTPSSSDVLPIDGATTRKTTIQAAVEAGRPAASQAEAEAGTDPTKVMTPLATKQAVTSYGLTKAGNLSGLTNTTTARTNLGLGSSAVESAASFLRTANNLSDLPNTATARANLGNPTAIGIGATDLNMGTYTGSTIPDNETAKQNIQTLETATEARPTSALLAGTTGASLIGYDPPAGATPDPTTVKARLDHLLLDVTGPSNQGYYYRYCEVPDDDRDGTSGGIGKVDGQRITHFFGGPSTKGGRHAIQTFAILQEATSGTNPDRNYVGGAFSCHANVSDGGSLPATPLGAVFGINAVGNLAAAAATGFLNVTSAEFNVNAVTGSSVKYKSGIQIAGFSTDAVQGTDFDAMVSLSGLGGVGWKTGMLFSAANGSQPIDPAGTLIGTNGVDTVAKGIDFTSYTFSSYAIATPGFQVGTNGSLTLSTAGAAIEIGSTVSAGTPVIDFHSSGNANDYDSRILASGGAAGAGQGGLSFIAAQLSLQGNTIITPSASVTPATNGDMVFELTSNTQLKIKVKGSDSVVRSVSLTLA